MNKCSTQVERVDKSKKEKIIKKLKDFLANKSANAILQIAKEEDYKDLFSDESISFISKNGGLIKVKTYIEDDNYQNWIIAEILKH